MTINVTNCGNCIFRKQEFNILSQLPFSTIEIDICLLLNEDDNIIAVYSHLTKSGKRFSPKSLNKRLDNCPLNNEEVIVKLNV